MKKRKVAALALAAGLAAGTVVGYLDGAEPISGPRHAAAECPTSGSVTKFATRLSVREGLGQQAQVQASAAAEIEQADGSWTPDRLPLCVFANGQTQEFPSQPEYQTLGPPQLAIAEYHLDKSKLQVKYADTQVRLQGPAGQPDSELYGRFSSSAVLAYRQGRVLHLDIDICRSPRARLACKERAAEAEPFSVELTIADNVRAENSRVTSRPQPASLKPDTDAKTTTYTWRMTDPTTPLAVEIPLAWTVRWTAQSFPIGDQGNLAIGTARFRINWPTLWDSIPSLLALAITTIMLGRFGKRTTGIGLTLAFTALLAGMTIQVIPYQPWQSVLLACSWAIATIFSAVSWRVPLTSAAVFGSALTVGGAIGDLPIATSIGLLTAVTAGLLSLGARLLVIPRTLSIAASADTSPWFKRRVLPVRGLFARVALFVLIATAAASAGDAIGRHASSYRSDATRLVEVVATVSGSNLGWVVLSATAVLVLCLCLAKFNEVEPAQLLITSPQVVALTLVVAIVAPPPSVRWAGVSLPVWLLTWLTLSLAVRGRTQPSLVRDDLTSSERLALAIGAERSRSEVLAMDAKLAAGTASLTDLEASTSRHRTAFPDDLAVDLLRRGPGGGWLPNAKTAAWIGAAVSLIPVGYYVFGALETLPGRLPYNGLFYLAVGIFIEFARWLGLAFAFGALYRRLPTRVGASKAAVLGIAWMVGAGLAELVARWAAAPPSGVWLYLSLQTIVFLIALGAIYDLMTIERAGGTWRRLTDLYRIQTVRQRLAYLGPLLLALIGLADQIRSGAPGELAEQLLTGLGAMVG